MTMKTNTREELTALFYKYSAADPNDKRYLDKFLDDLEALIEKEKKEAYLEIFNISCDLPENYMFGESGKLSAINNLIMKRLAELEKEE